MKVEEPDEDKDYVSGAARMFDLDATEEDKIAQQEFTDEAPAPIQETVATIAAQACPLQPAAPDLELLPSERFASSRRAPSVKSPKLPSKELFGRLPSRSSPTSGLT